VADAGVTGVRRKSVAASGTPFTLHILLLPARMRLLFHAAQVHYRSITVIFAPLNMAYQRRHNNEQSSRRYSPPADGVMGLHVRQVGVVNAPAKITDHQYLRQKAPVRIAARGHLGA